jgi:hypothetical protein
MASGTPTKAAERKRKFEAAKKELQENKGQVRAPVAVPGETLFLTPTVFTGHGGDSRQFDLFAMDGKHLVSDEWGMSDAGVGERKTEMEPTVEFMATEKTTLCARLGGR